MLQKGSGPNGKARASLDLQTHASTVEPPSEQDCIAHLHAERYASLKICLRCAHTDGMAPELFQKSEQMDKNYDLRRRSIYIKSED